MSREDRPRQHCPSRNPFSTAALSAALGGGPKRAREEAWQVALGALEPPWRVAAERLAMMGTVPRVRTSRTRNHKGKLAQAYEAHIRKLELECARWMDLIDAIEARHGKERAEDVADRQTKYIRKQASECERAWTMRPESD